MADSDPSPAAGEQQPVQAESPTQWPPENYRQWVESQIASKMLVKLSAILGVVGVGTLAAIVTGYLSWQGQLLKNQQQSMEKTVEDQVLNSIRPQISSQIAERLLDASGLVEKAEQRLPSRIDALLTQQLADPEFRNKIAQTVIDELIEDGDLQAVIMDVALRKANDPEFNPTTRALALQMFALFHGGELTQTTGWNLREQFVLLAESATIGGGGEPGAEPKTFPLKLMEAVLRHYPVGIRIDSECTDDLVLCESHDDRIIAAMLANVPNDDEDFEQLSADLDAFFRAVSPRTIDAIKVWVRANSDHIAAPAIASAVLASTDETVLAAAVPIMVEFVYSEDPMLRFLGLEALAATGHNRPIPENTRADALDALWTITPTAILRDATADALVEKFEFAPDERLNSRSIIMDGYLEHLSELVDWEASFKAYPEQHELLFNALLNLIRTGDDGREWNSIIQAKLIGHEPSIPDATERNGHAFRIWAARMELDHGSGQPSAAAAAKQLLEALPDGFVTDQVISEAVAKTIRFATRESLADLADRHADHWQRGAQDDPHNLIRAIIARDRSMPAPYSLLDSLLAQRPADQASGWDSGSFSAHLLVASLAQGEEDLAKLPRSELLQWIARRANELVASDDPAELALCRILLDQLNLALDHHGVVTTAAIERSSLLPVEDPAEVLAPRINALQRRLSWIGESVSAEHTILFDDESSRTLALPVGESTRWYRASSDVSRRYSAESLPGLEIVFADIARTQYYRHFSAGERAEPIVVPAGTFAIGLRSQTPPESEAITRRIKGERAPSRIAPSPDYETYPVTLPFLFEVVAGDQPGALTLQFDAAQGQILHLQTRSINESEYDETDTILDLFDASSEQFIATNDDHNMSFFSEIVTELDIDRELLLRVYDFDDINFASEISFLLSGTILAPDQVLKGTTSALEPAIVDIETEVVIETIEQTAWLAFHSDQTRSLSVDTKAAFWVYEASDLSQAIHSNEFRSINGNTAAFQVSADARYFVKLVVPDDTSMTRIAIREAPPVQTAAER